MSTESQVVREGHHRRLYKWLEAELLTPDHQPDPLELLIAMGDIYRARVADLPPRAKEWLVSDTALDQVHYAMMQALHSTTGLLILPSLQLSAQHLSPFVKRRDRWFSLDLMLNNHVPCSPRRMKNAAMPVVQFIQSRDAFDQRLGEIVARLKLEPGDLQPMLGVTRLGLSAEIPPWMLLVCVMRRPVQEARKVA